MVLRLSSAPVDGERIRIRPTQCVRQYLRRCYSVPALCDDEVHCYLRPRRSVLICTVAIGVPNDRDVSSATDPHPGPSGRPPSPRPGRGIPAPYCACPPRPCCIVTIMAKSLGASAALGLPSVYSATATTVSVNIKGNGCVGRQMSAPLMKQLLVVASYTFIRHPAVTN